MGSVCLSLQTSLVHPVPNTANVPVLTVPILKVAKLNINSQQKLALVGVFGVGTIVAAIEVMRGTWLLVEPSTQEATALSLIWITLQGTLGIVATNLPILRPLFFRRSFGSSNQSGAYGPGSGHRLPWVKSPPPQSIPLYEMPNSDYGGHAVVSSGVRPGERENTEHALETGKILKSVEVRVQTQSATSSIIGGRHERKFFGR